MCLHSVTDLLLVQQVSLQETRTKACGAQLGKPGGIKQQVPQNTGCCAADMWSCVA
jgi:hypothetical protein